MLDIFDVHKTINTNSISSKGTSDTRIIFKLNNVQDIASTAVDEVEACVLVTQRARVRSPVGTGFLGEAFSGFFLTCKSNVEILGPQGPRISFGHHYHPYSFITGVNDLRC